MSLNATFKVLLIANADNMYVIGRQGDSEQLEFPNATPTSNGLVRDYFIIASCWFKGQGLPYVPFTIDSLPFRNMTGYPYPSTEKYPIDLSHNNYLTQYNTRIIDNTKPDAIIKTTSGVYNQIDIGKLFAANISFLIAVVWSTISSAFRLEK
jgi:hypothetical protein